MNNRRPTSSSSTTAAAVLRVARTRARVRPRLIHDRNDRRQKIIITLTNEVEREGGGERERGGEADVIIVC